MFVCVHWLRNWICPVAMTDLKGRIYKQRMLPSPPSLVLHTSNETTDNRPTPRTAWDLNSTNSGGSKSQSHSTGPENSDPAQNRISRDIVFTIRAAELAEKNRLAMASVHTLKDNISSQKTEGDKNISVVKGSLHRLAGIKEISQDNNGYIIRKIEIIKVPGQGLGFFIRKGNGWDKKEGVFISRVTLGSMVDINGLLHAGDEVLEVNRVNLKGFPLEDVALMMQIPDKLILTTRSVFFEQSRSRSVDSSTRLTDSSEEQLQKAPVLPYPASKLHPGLRGRSYTSTESKLADKRNDTSNIECTSPRQYKKLGTGKFSPSSIFNVPEVLDSQLSATRKLPEAPGKAAKDSISRKLPMPPKIDNDQNDLVVGPAGGATASKTLNDYGITDSSKSETMSPTKINEPSSSLTISRTLSKERPSPSHQDSNRFYKRSQSIDEGNTRNKANRLFEPYSSDDLNSEMKFTRGFSGMLAVHLIKVEQVFCESNASKCYFTVEVDDEFKASTTKKEHKGSKITFDELFDIEISRACELTLYFFSIGSSKQHHLISSGTIFLQRALGKKYSHGLAFVLESNGILYMTLDFTEAVKLLKRTPSSRRRGVFGFNLVSTLDEEKDTIPVIVRKCVEEVEKRGLQKVGIYRVSGNARKKRLLKAEFDQDSHAVDVSEDACVDCNTLAGILKDYLRELPEPLISPSMYSKLLKSKATTDSPDLNKRQIVLSDLMKLIPYANRVTLIYIIDHLLKVAENAEANKMDISNLAVCFGPVLMCPPSTSSSAQVGMLDFKLQIEALGYLLKVWPKQHERYSEVEITSM